MTRSLLVRAEVRRLVGLAGAPLDLFLFGQEPLELGIGLADDRRHLLGGARLLARGRPRLGRRRAGLGLIGPPASATGRAHPAGPARARRLPPAHGGLAAALV